MNYLKKIKFRDYQLKKGEEQEQEVSNDRISSFHFFNSLYTDQLIRFDLLEVFFLSFFL